MKKSLVAILLFTTFCFAQNNAEKTQTNVITYSGTFQYGNFSSDVNIDVDKTLQETKVYFTSLEQNAFKIPAIITVLEKDSLHFELRSDYYTYKFKGEFTDNHLRLNLNVEGLSQDFLLIKSSKAKEFTNKKKVVDFNSQGLNLYGTIWYPSKFNGKAIYFVTSSGNSDRSASRAEALLFTQKGYIAFHIDKRGTGKSEGNWHTATMDELCNDDINAIQFLSKEEHLSISQIGIKGSSQGAAKVPFILNQLNDLSFGIAVSCPGSSLLESDLNFWKNRNVSIIGETDIEEAMKMQRMVFEYIAGEVNQDDLEKIIALNDDKTWFSHIWVPNFKETKTDKKLLYTPIPFFEQTDQPLLIIQGTADQVIPKNSYKVITKSIENKSNPKNKVVLLEGADHSMYNKENSDFQYWSALHPQYLPIIFNWTNTVN